MCTSRYSIPELSPTPVIGSTLHPRLDVCYPLHNEVSSGNGQANRHIERSVPPPAWSYQPACSLPDRAAGHCAARGPALRGSTIGRGNVSFASGACRHTGRHRTDRIHPWVAAGKQPRVAVSTPIRRPVPPARAPRPRADPPPPTSLPRSRPHDLACGGIRRRCVGGSLPRPRSWH